MLSQPNNKTQNHRGDREYFATTRGNLAEQVKKACILEGAMCDRAARHDGETETPDAISSRRRDVVMSS